MHLCMYYIIYYVPLRLYGTYRWWHIFVLVFGKNIMKSNSTDRCIFTVGTVERSITTFATHQDKSKLNVARSQPHPFRSDTTTQARTDDDRLTIIITMMTRSSSRGCGGIVYENMCRIEGWVRFARAGLCPPSSH